MVGGGGGVVRVVKIYVNEGIAKGKEPNEAES